MWIRINQDQSETESRNATWLISKKSRIENNLPELMYTIQLASEKGASSCLNALPLSKHGFDLSKTEFRDGIALRYTWEAKNTPALCPCGKEFNLSQAVHCAKGGYTHLRHNEIRDVIANLMDDVCHDVQIQPKLQSLDGKFSRVIPPLLMMTLDWTSRQMVCGAPASIAHSSMWRFSTLTRRAALRP